MRKINWKQAGKKAVKLTNKFSGADDLVEYMGTKIAKAKAPKAQKQYITSKATGKQALKSAGRVAVTAASMVPIGKAVTAVKASRALSASKAAKTAGYNKLGAHGKRLVKWEQEARNAAAKRARNKTRRK